MTRSGAKSLGVLGVVFVAGAIVSLIFGPGLLSRGGPESAERPTEPTIAREVHLGRGAGFTNPLLDYLSESTPDPFLLSLKGEIEDLANEYAETGVLQSLSVYFRDLDGGQWFGINEDHVYEPASLLKVPLLVTYLKLAESDDSLLQEKVRYDDLYGASTNKFELPPLEHGRMYSLWELLERMIVHSDNPSSDLLAAHLFEHWDRQTIDSLLGQFDLFAPTRAYQDGTLVVSARSYSGLFRVLYNSTYLNRDMSEVALGLLARSSFDRGIVAGVPPGVVVANKLGFGGDPNDASDFQVHDCGIVYSDPGPYILCILTKTNGELSAHEIISAVSKKVYDHLHRADRPPPSLQTAPFMTPRNQAPPEGIPPAGDRIPGR